MDPLDSTLAGRTSLNPGIINLIPTASTQNIIAVLRGDVIDGTARSMSYADGVALVAATSGGGISEPTTSPNSGTGTGNTGEVSLTWDSGNWNTTNWN